jgi:hypothetical protein
MMMEPGKGKPEGKPKGKPAQGDDKVTPEDQDKLGPMEDRQERKDKGEGEPSLPVDEDPTQAPRFPRKQGKDQEKSHGPNRDADGVEKGTAADRTPKEGK